MIGESPYFQCFCFYFWYHIRFGTPHLANMVVTSFQCFHPNRVFSDILPFDTLGFVVGLSYSSSIPFNIDLGCESMGDVSPIIMVVLCAPNCDVELLRHTCTISSSSICMSMEAIKSYTNSWSWWCSCWSTRPFVVIILLNYFGSWSLLVVVFLASILHRFLHTSWC